MTHLDSITPNLMVNDVNKTISYYQKILGFTLLQTVPEQGNLDWAMVKRNDVILMFQSIKSLKTEFNRLENQKPGGGMTLYIKMAGVEELAEEYANKAEIISPLKDTFYDRREFSIVDLNGYILTLSEEI